MQLYIKRNQRDTGLLSTKVIFMLDVRLDLTADEMALVKKHKLHKEMIYESDGAKRSLGALFSAGKNSADAAFALTKMAYHAVALSFSLKCTYQSLIDGQHIECKDLGELADAELAIRNACDNASTFLNIARSFDGREEVYNIA